MSRPRVWLDSEEESRQWKAFAAAALAGFMANPEDGSNGDLMTDAGTRTRYARASFLIADSMMWEVRRREMARLRQVQRLLEQTHVVRMGDAK